MASIPAAKRSSGRNRKSKIQTDRFVTEDSADCAANTAATRMSAHSLTPLAAGVQRNTRLFHDFSAAADFGSSEAQAKLAIFCSYGLGAIQLNYRKAFVFAAKARDAGVKGENLFL